MQDPINPSLYQTPQTPASAAGASTSSAPVTQTSMDMSVQPSKFSKFNLKQNKFKLKIVLPIILLFLVVGSVLAGMVLVQTSQDVRQQASGGGPDYSCGTGDDLFSNKVPFSAPCLWAGAPYYKCVSGYHNEDFGCKEDVPGASVKPSIRPSSVPSVRPSSMPTVRPSSVPSIRPTILPSIRPSSLPTTVSQIGGQDSNSCGTGYGLFQSYVDYSIPCLWGGAPYYKCDDANGYINHQGGCVESEVVLMADNGTCGTMLGLFNSEVANSEPCQVSDEAARILGNRDYFKCKDDYHNANGGCVLNGDSSFRVSGSLPYGEFCEPCTNEEPCGYTFEACTGRINELYGMQECHEIGNCYIGYYVPVGTCPAYPDVTTCREAEDAEAAALAASQMCWSLSSNCTIGWAPMGQTSCEVGTFPDTQQCLQALAIQNSIFGPIFETLGSLSGASVGGE